ncbi:MAG: SLBB domain-containing protein, partial [Chloroflexi bacterium]|nr:SLBB domain-containing protein [Chloroflexota bacterium]
PAILENGSAWFHALGRGENAGTKLYSLSGSVRRPGNYELPLGVTARELIEAHGGGPVDGRTMKAFTLGGISGGLLGAEHLGIALDYTSNRALGVSPGSGGVVVLDETACIVDFVRTCMHFYEDESCGRCFPCRIGTTRLRELLDGLTGRTALSRDALTRLDSIGALMATTSACGLGQAAPLVITGMFRSFRAEVDAHAVARVCPTGVCPL